MDPQNDPKANQVGQHNNEQQINMVNEIHDGLNSFRDLSHQPRVTREIIHLYLVSSLETMNFSIQDTQTQLTNITKFRTRMRELYSNGESKETIKPFVGWGWTQGSLWLFQQNPTNIGTSNTHIAFTCCK